MPRCVFAMGFYFAVNSLTDKTMAKKKEEGKNQQELGYEEAYARLQRIVADMESEQITVDELSAKLQEAVKLLAICKHKLFDTEKEVQSILEGMESE